MASKKCKMKNIFKEILVQVYSKLRILCERTELSNFTFSILELQLFLFTVFILCFQTQVFALEDCIITTDGKMSDITIQNRNVIDIFPLVTIMNDKNTIIVHPLKIGETNFSLLKDNKEKFFFDVKVTREKTFVKDVDGFEILTIDCPPTEEYFELDGPPTEIEMDKPPRLN